MNKGFKKVLAVVAAILLTMGILVGCKKDEVTTEELTTVRLNEVVRSIFYAPMYVALNQGFFEKQGLQIELATGNGADKTMQALLSGNADIGFSGPEQTVYIYNQGREDYPVVFAQLTQRDGSFLVGRNAESNFDWASLEGKELIGARPGGIPEMALEYVLKQNGLDPKTDINMITNIDYTATAAAFKSGTGEYVALFEPNASTLVQQDGGQIVASIGESAGNISYTCFYSTQSYIRDNPKVVQKFTNAIKEGQDWVATHTSVEIAEQIAPYFPAANKDILVSVIDNYKKIEAYATTPVVNTDGMKKLMDIIQQYDSKLISERPPLDKLINNTFAEKAK